MTKFKDIIITTAGQNALNKAVSDGNKITYTKASLSATDLTSKSISDIQAITTLDSSKDSTLTLISTENGSVVLSATFDNAGLTNDINFNSVGWFAKTDQQAEFLFAVSRYNVEQVLGTIAPDSDATQSITLQIGLAVSQGNVQITETQAGVAMKADLNKAVINLNDTINQLDNIKADKSQVASDLAKKADQLDVDSQINAVTKSVSDLTATVKSNQDITDKELDTKADKANVELALAGKADSTEVINSIKQLTDTVNTKADQSDIDASIKPVNDALATKANTTDVNKELSTKITFVKCSSPQEAHDISAKPASDGSMVVGIYDMDDEPSEAIVGDKKVTISTLYNALNDLQSQVTGLSNLQALIEGKVDKATVDAEIAKIDFTPYAKKTDVDSSLKSYTTTADLIKLLANKRDITDSYSRAELDKKFLDLSTDTSGKVSADQVASLIASKADKDAVDKQIKSVTNLANSKANITDVNTALSKKDDTTDVDQKISTVTKSVSDLSDEVATNQQAVTSMLSSKANASDVADDIKKINTTIATKADTEMVNKAISKIDFTPYAKTIDVNSELATKADKDDLTPLAKTDDVNKRFDTVIQSITDASNREQADNDKVTKSISDLSSTVSDNETATQKSLATKITFVKCSSPQEAHDVSSKPADDGSIVVGIYDMDDEPTTAVIGDKKVTISTLYEALNDLQGQVTSLSALQTAIDSKASKTDVESDLSNKADKSQITDLQNQISELKDNQFEVQTFSDEDSGKTWEAQKAGHRLAVIEN